MDLADRAELLVAEPDVYNATEHYVAYSTVPVRSSRVNPDVLLDLPGNRSISATRGDVGGPTPKLLLPAGQFKDPEGRVPVRRILNVRHEHAVSRRLEAAVANDHRHVLLAVCQVRDGRGARHVVHTLLPEQLAICIVVSAELPIERSREDDTSRRVKHACG